MNGLKVNRWSALHVFLVGERAALGANFPGCEFPMCVAGMPMRGHAGSGGDI